MALRQLDQQVDTALVLEVAERLHGFALNVEIGVLAGDRCQRVARRPLGTSAERFDRLASRVPIRQRPGQRNQHRRGFRQGEIAKRFGSLLAHVRAAVAARDAIQSRDRRLNRMVPDPLHGIAAQVVRILARDTPFEPGHHCRRGVVDAGRGDETLFQVAIGDRAVEAVDEVEALRGIPPRRARTRSGSSSRPAAKAC